MTDPVTSRECPAGVLLMAHGTPDSLDEMPDYLTRVRGGRPPSPELVEEMRHNYAAIGGRSPLTAITTAQGEALQAELGPSYVVRVGMRNWTPTLADGIRALVDRRAREIVAIPMAPQFSTLSVQKYIDAAMAATPNDVAFGCVRSFHAHPGLIDAFAARIHEAQPQPDERIVFTAHSLPVRVSESGDPYAREVEETAAAVAARAGVASYDRAFQSAGRTPEPWLGPDLNEYIRAASAAGARAFLVVPIGFVCDHTEILFDIDVQAAGTARTAGVRLRRTASLNTSPVFIRALADLVRA
jgi:protoporphyrin/coproporphyrin ferrochelatase